MRKEFELSTLLKTWILNCCCYAEREIGLHTDLPWLRWWDEQENLLLTGEERAEIERQRADTAKLLLQQERERAERLRAMGVEVEE